MISKIKIFLEEMQSLFLTAYLMIMAVVYPLYMKGTYKNLGEDKYIFFKFITMSALILVVILSIICFIIKTGEKKKQAYFFTKERFSVTDILVILYMIAIIFSYALSKYPEEAFKGSYGWHMGLETLLLITGIYLLFSCTWKYTPIIWAAFLGGSAVVFILGICNRFSIYPIELPQVSPDFISTLGNINWFCGYFSVIWPIGACIYIFSRKKSLRVCAGFYMAIAFISGVTQGSSSVFLSFLAVFYLLLFPVATSWEYGKRWLELAGIWCLACQAVRLVRYYFPERYNYETDNLCGIVTNSGITVYFLLLIVLTYFIMKYFSVKNFSIKNIKKPLWTGILIAAPLALLGVYFTVTAVNTLLPGGIPGLKDNSIFVFNSGWGSARGATWSAGMKVFGRMSLTEKITGAGPDCFAKYLYSFVDLAVDMQKIFGDALLKNAHNEGITMLVNTGIIGFVTYIGIFVSVIIRFLKKGAFNWILFIPAVCAFSYMVHNMVSFGQVLNMPFVFMIMGIGENVNKVIYLQKEAEYEKTEGAGKKKDTGLYHEGAGN